MIKPTVGRIVLFCPKDTDFGGSIRFAALIAFVHDDGKVNLSVANIYGEMESEQKVTLVQDDEVPKPGQCEWMPYQKGQAAKYDVTTDDLQARMNRLEKLITQAEDFTPVVATGITDFDEKQTGDATVSGADGPGDILEPNTSLDALVAYADNNVLSFIEYLDSAGGLCVENFDVAVKARYVFDNSVVFVVTKDEAETLDNFRFNLETDINEAGSKEAEG